MQALSKPCDEWPSSRFKKGYGQDKSIPGEQYAHRAQWIRHHGPIPFGLAVLHHCDNPPCREITHLFLGTNQDNTNDMIAKRRHMHGERHVHAKMTDDKVRALRGYRRAGYTLEDLAWMFSIAVPTVSRIARGLAWSHVQDDDKGKHDRAADS